MPKRSSPGKPEFELLDRAIETMLRSSAEPQTVSPSLAPLVRIAAALRALPRESFKASLKAELERSTSMATEPATAVRISAAPRMAFQNAAKAIDFYKSAFGAREKMRFEVGGGIAHAEIMIGESSIMLCEEWPEGGRYSAETLGKSPVSISLDVPDVDAFVQHAVSAGAKLVLPPKDQFYGRRDATLLDPFGYTWSASTVKEDMPVEEMHRRFRAVQGGQKPEERPASPPAGFRAVTPYLIAQDGAALIDFVKEAFGAEELHRSIGPAGGIHTEVRIGDSRLMIGGGIPGREFKSSPKTHGLHVYVEDADAVYQRALDAGATPIQAPADQEYGERSGSVKDAVGNHWYIATGKGGTYIPEGLNNVNAYLHPLRAEPVIGFLKRAFGALEIAKYAGPNGVIHHAAIRIGDSVVEMGEAHGPYQPQLTMFYLYVPDVDSVYHRAIAAGGTSISAPQDQPYGDRNAGVKDPFGNEWYVATPLTK